MCFVSKNGWQNPNRYSIVINERFIKVSFSSENVSYFRIKAENSLWLEAASDMLGFAAHLTPFTGQNLKIPLKHL